MDYDRGERSHEALEDARDATDRAGVCRVSSVVVWVDVSDLDK